METIMHGIMKHSCRYIVKED